MATLAIGVSPSGVATGISAEKLFKQSEALFEAFVCHFLTNPELAAWYTDSDQ
jgi:hypothetical protein